MSTVRPVRSASSLNSPPWAKMPVANPALLSGLRSGPNREPDLVPSEVAHLAIEDWPEVPDDAGYGTPELMRDLVAQGGLRAQASIRSWLDRKRTEPEGEAIVAFVNGLRYKTLYSLTVDDLMPVTRWKKPRYGVSPLHALGKHEKIDVEEVLVEDWRTPPWSFNMLFHEQMESIGRIPTWPEVYRYFNTTARERVWNRFKHDFALDTHDSPWKVGFREKLKLAFRWRLGRAYYSFIREVDLLVRLRRQHGLDVRYHLLADLQLKVDLFCGKALLEVFIGSPRIRQEQKNRKIPCARMMDVRNFETREIELNRVPTRGYPELVTAAEILGAAEKIKRAAAKS